MTCYRYQAIALTFLLQQGRRLVQRATQEEARGRDQFFPFMYYKDLAFAYHLNYLIFDLTF